MLETLLGVAEATALADTLERWAQGLVDLEVDDDNNVEISAHTARTLSDEMKAMAGKIRPRDTHAECKAIRADLAGVGHG